MLPTLASVLDVLLFLAGGLLLGALARWWRPEVSWRAVGGYLLLAFAFYAVPLATPASQAATDIAYLHLPWKETLEEPARPGNPNLSDLPLQLLPFRSLVRARLLAGEAPLWAHELGTGQPLLGNAQSVPFAPLHLLALPRPPLAAMTVTAAWQMLVGLLLMHALLLRLGAGGQGAAFGAVALALSSYAVAWAYYPLGAVVAWVPGMLLGVVLLRRGERGGFAGLVACATAAALAGHPESLANAALASAAVTVALLAAKEAGRLRFLARLAAAAALTFALSAPAVLPFLEALAESERWEAVRRNPRIVQPAPPSAATLLPAVQPLVHGNPREGTWQGPGRSNFNELCAEWAGLAALAVAIAGAATLRGRVLAILLAGGAALAAALRVPPFFDAMQALPLLGHGAHGRLRLLWVLAVAVAAGLSLERLARRRGVLAGALAFALLGGTVVALPPPGESSWTRAWWLAALAGAAACLAALLVPRLRPAFPNVALGALAIELFLLGVHFHPALDPRFDLSPPPVVAWLADRAREGPPHRVLAEGRDLMPNLAALHGVWDARAHDPMSPAAPSAFIGRRLRPHHKVGRLILHGPRRDPGLENYLGVRYLLTRHRARVPPPWRSAFNHQGGRVWENPKALPLFFMPSQVEHVENQGEALERARANSDFAAKAVVEKAAHASAQGGTVQIARVRPNGFDLTAGGLGGVVVSSVTHARGWRATLDARPLPLLRANGAFLAFAVPAGRHRVSLDYRPIGWPVGWAFFFTGSLAATILALRSRSRGAAPGKLFASAGKT